MGKEPIETFDSLTLPIRNFVAWATGLPESVSEWVLLKDEELLHIKLNIGIYLSNNVYCQQLEHWCNLLNNITNEKIEDAFLLEHSKDLNKTPIEIFEESYQDEEYEAESPFRMSYLVELKWDAAIHQRDRIKDFITDILKTRKKLIPKPKTKQYFKYLGKPAKLNDLRDELFKYRMIGDKSYFCEILQGHKKAEAKTINWIRRLSYLTYFIDELFKTELFERENLRWKIAETCFTLNGEPIENLRTNNKKIDEEIQNTIDNVIKCLKTNNSPQKPKGK